MFRVDVCVSVTDGWWWRRVHSVAVWWKNNKQSSSRKHFFGNGKVIQYVYARAAERGLTVWAADEMRRSYSGEYTRLVYSGKLAVVWRGCGGVDGRSGSGRGGRHERDVNERQIMRQTGDRWRWQITAATDCRRLVDAVAGRSLRAVAVVN